MNKPVLFVLYISFACCIGFIGGMFFGGFYNQNIVVKTVSEYNEVQKLMEWYKLIVIDQLQLKELEAIKSMHDVDPLKAKYRKNGLAHIRLFREQTKNMKKNAPNPSAIVEFEDSINKIEKYFRQEQP